MGIGEHSERERKKMNAKYGSLGAFWTATCVSVNMCSCMCLVAELGSEVDKINCVDYVQ